MKRVALLVCMVLLVSSCTRRVSKPLELSVEYLHLSGPCVVRQVMLDAWCVREVPMEKPLFEVLRVRIGDKQYICDDQLLLYDIDGQKRVVISERAQQELTQMYTELKAVACAKPLPWPEAAKLLERLGTAKVTDIETGRSFNVQRRGGTYHADVQPLSRADTAVMKEIYGGVWSWDRRAIIVTTEGVNIAASMNGMPHGRGALNNNFPGHFCIHFWGSITHATRSKDLGHHLMISKAAGEVWSLVREATPEAQVRNLAAAINQKDWWLVQLFLLPGGPVELEHALAHVETLEIDEAVLGGAAHENCTVNVTGEIIYRGGSRAKFVDALNLSLYHGVWLIDVRSIKGLIK